MDADTLQPIGNEDRLGRASVAELVADYLRTRIGEGAYPPGEKVSEEEICQTLSVSRNTTREAFKLLTHERLLVHRLNRGVFVRKPSAADIADIYRVRMLVECAVIRSLGEPPYALKGMTSAVIDGERALAAQDWNVLGAANFHFHRELVALAGSPRIDTTMRTVLAELRLALHGANDPQALHAPYLARNRILLETIARGDIAEAEQLLGGYLADSVVALAQMSTRHPTA